MSLAALPSVECRCSDLRLSYLQQTVHFFQSDTHTAIPNKLAFTSLHCSISNYTLKGLRSDKPSHKHGPNKYPPGGGYFRNFWVGMCRWDPGTLDLYQS